MQKILSIWLFFIFSNIYANLFEIGNLDVSGIYQIQNGHLKYHDEVDKKNINQGILVIDKIKNSHYGYYYITKYSGNSHFNNHYGGFIIENSKIKPLRIDYYSNSKIVDKSNKFRFLDEETLEFNSHSLNADTYRVYKKIYDNNFTNQKISKELTKSKKNYEDFYKKYVIKTTKTPALF